MHLSLPLSSPTFQLQDPEDILTTLSLIFLSYKN